jgi:hypothetical protein
MILNLTPLVKIKYSSFFFFNESAFTNAIANMDTAEVSISNYAKSVVSMRSLLGKG